MEGIPDESIPLYGGCTSPSGAVWFPESPGFYKNLLRTTNDTLVSKKYSGNEIRRLIFFLLCKPILSFTTLCYVHSSTSVHNSLMDWTYQKEPSIHLLMILE